jgi:hypothetical protein
MFCKLSRPFVLVALLAVLLLPAGCVLSSSGSS